MEVVDAYRYLEFILTTDWTLRLFTRKDRGNSGPSNLCNKMLEIFYQSVVASTKQTEQSHQKDRLCSGNQPGAVTGGNGEEDAVQAVVHHA